MWHFCMDLWLWIIIFIHLFHCWVAIIQPSKIIYRSIYGGNRSAFRVQGKTYEVPHMWQETLLHTLVIFNFFHIVRWHRNRVFGKWKQKKIWTHPSHMTSQLSFSQCKRTLDSFIQWKCTFARQRHCYDFSCLVALENGVVVHFSVNLTCVMRQYMEETKSRMW